ncbi:hypothetical protein JHK84_031284 [Glycine max]|nr:hypothetical protein JHK85_031704 [Glycine max]KAG4994327.1 hypothetical protein JHK86_031154 [Glycine max]KAG5145741.1 hypothetical protein JHK84_031284 [Glycine max]
MEIGLPSNFRHVSHVAFDRFNGFLGLPMEFKAEAPKRALSARSKDLDGSMVFGYRRVTDGDQSNSGAEGRVPKKGKTKEI